MRLLVAARDPGATGVLRATVIVTKRAGARPAQRVVRLRQGAARSINVGRLKRGRYEVRVDLRDRAGNVSSVFRRILVR